VTDRPHLVGWGSLHRTRRRSLTSFVVIAGTASPVPGPAGSWLDTPLAGHASRSPARPRAPPRRALRSDVTDNQDAFRRVTIDRVAPIADPVNALLVDCAQWFRAPFSPRSRRLVCQHGVRRAPWSATCRRFALRFLVRHDARCVGPTSAFSRSSYEHPRLVGSRCVMRLRACAFGEIACLTSVRFASVGRTLWWCHRGGRFLPVAMRAVRTSDISVASST